MAEICIDAEVVGTSQHLHVTPDGFEWVDDVPGAAWHLTGRPKPESTRCMDTLLRLNDRAIDVSPPPAWARCARQCVPRHLRVPWARFMSTGAHRSFLGGIVTRAVDSMVGADTAYYEGSWVPGSAILSVLARARVDRTAWAALMAQRTGNTAALKSFAPNDEGIAKPVVYDRFATKTGRLGVVHGPQVLTLNRDHRCVLVPCRPDRQLLYIDFEQLEPRILLYEAGRSCSSDLYTHVAAEALGMGFDRSTAKGAVISLLYGESVGHSAARLGVAEPVARRLLRKVERFFALDDIRSRLGAQHRAHGYITSRHGRRLTPEDHLRVNYFAQSTGVDVALMGFSALNTELLRPNLVLPLFVLHDALIVDAPAGFLESTGGTLHINVPGYVQRFPLSVKPLNA